MGGTLKSLAGPAFSASDVIAARQPVIPPEQLVLDRYVFLPHVRSGIAAALDAPFTWGGPDRATLKISVPVNDDRGALSAQMTVHVHGPASVLEIAAQQVIRVFPKADAADAEVEDLAHVEFDRPDLPWMFTPAGPDAAGRLAPWIALVAVERGAIRWGKRRGTSRDAEIRRDQLQPLADAWAWAHAQVMGAKDSGPPLAQRLSESNAAQNLSRLVCPRRLKPGTQYVACVVPTFRCGADVALGLKPATQTLEPAWGSTADFASGDPAAMVPLPVYFSWEFSTGEQGNFESLARLLRPAVAPAGVGRRRVDATRPWSPLALAANDPGSEVVIKGPVVSLMKPEDDPTQVWPAETQWSAEVSDELTRKLNNPDLQTHSQPAAAPDAPAEPPLVGPPLYGSMHARQRVIETDAAAAAAQPPWFRDLNTDPRNRVVGGLGMRVVQAEQEDLMASAWNQVIGVEAANQLVRFAQLSMHVSASLHRRHLARFTDAAVLAVTERVHAKVLALPQRSIWSTLDVSSLPTSVVSGAFRRLAAVRGKLVRKAVALRSDRAVAVETLVVAPDRWTVDWVRPYRNPDGITAVGPLAKTLITPEIAAQVLPGSDPDSLAGQLSAALAKPALTDVLTPETLANTAVPDTLDVSRPLLETLMRRVVSAVPRSEEIRRNAEVAFTAASSARLLGELADIASRQGLDRVEISAREAHRLELDAAPGREGSDTVSVPTQALQVLAGRALELSRGVGGGEIPWQELESNAAQLRAFVERNSRVGGQVAFAALVALAKKVSGEDRFVESDRARVDVPALQLLRLLDPKVTVPRRVAARLSAGSGFPQWLRPDWFADGRLEMVMAHPRFHYPMYEPLYRYDPEWVVAGLGLIQRGEMVTLLETNNAFIEAYLVGLNHEMARELLWRGYPTDQRGTYFDSFWTGDRELIADLHELPWRSGALASHMDPGLEGRLVFLVRGNLVRRYPGVVAHVVRQARDGAGHLLTDNGVPLFEPASETTPRKALFHIYLAPNVLLAGFDMMRADLDVPGETWWFTLSENPTEPRFGLDDSREGPISRDDLTFDDFGVAPGAFLDATQAHALVDFTEPPSNPPPDRSRWGIDSAQTAYLLFQLPARAAFRAKNMVAGAGHP
jgi:hypothetical protein